jgi:hypothetical protein
VVDNRVIENREIEEEFCFRRGVGQGERSRWVDAVWGAGSRPTPFSRKLAGMGRKRFSKPCGILQHALARPEIRERTAALAEGAAHDEDALDVLGQVGMVS